MKHRHSVLAAPGAANFITTTVVNHIPIFSHAHLAEILLKKLKFYSYEYQVQINGFVIMPSHIHVLASVTSSNSISQFVGSLKGFSAKQILRWCAENRTMSYLDVFAAAGKTNRRDRKYQVWQEGYDNAVITREKDLLIKLNYIHNNPLQDKWRLCDYPEDYRYSSAAYYLEDKETEIPIVKVY